MIRHKDGWKLLDTFSGPAEKTIELWARRWQGSLVPLTSWSVFGSVVGVVMLAEVMWWYLGSWSCCYLITMSSRHLCRYYHYWLQSIIRKYHGPSHQEHSPSIKTWSRGGHYVYQNISLYLCIEISLNPGFQSKANNNITGILQENFKLIYM